MSAGICAFPAILSFRDENIQVTGTNQVMVSTFEREGKRRYYIVNLSSIYENSISVRLPQGKYRVCSMDGITESTEQIEVVL